MSLLTRAGALHRAYLRATRQVFLDVSRSPAKAHENIRTGGGYPS